MNINLRHNKKKNENSPDLIGHALTEGKAIQVCAYLKGEALGEETFNIFQSKYEIASNGGYDYYISLQDFEKGDNEKSPDYKGTCEQYGRAFSVVAWGGKVKNGFKMTIKRNKPFKGMKVA